MVNLKAEFALRLTYLDVEVQIKYWFRTLNIKHLAYFGAGIQ